MPFIDIKTNVPVSPDKQEAIKTAMGLAITDIPGKSEGDKAPAAMVEVSIFGKASDNALVTLTSHITGTLTDKLGISSDRIYVKYTSTDQWGWNGSNF